MALDTGKAWTDVTALAKGQIELLIVIAGLFVMLPALLIELYIPFRSEAKEMAPYLAALQAYLEAHGGVLLLVSIFSSFGQATIFALLLDRDRPTVREALRLALRRLGWFVLLNAIIGGLLLGGTMLFILPGLYLLGRTAPAQAALVAERLSNPIEAIRRAFAITAGNGWRSFLLVAVVYVTGSIVIHALGFAIGIGAALTGNGELARFMTALVETALATALGVVLLLVYAAIYRQLAGR